MRHQKRRGNVLVEFSLMLGLIWVPMLLCTFAVGFNLLSQLEVVQFARDAGHLWATSTVDLSADNVQNILNDVGGGAGFPSKAQVIFSKLVFVDAATCLAGDNTAACPNVGQWAYAQYLTLGTAPTLGAATYHTFLPPPSGGSPAADGSYTLLATTTQSGLAIGTALPSQLSQIQAYNSVAVTGLPSGQTINLVQVGAAPFNVPGVTSLLALTDYAVF